MAAHDAGFFKKNNLSVSSFSWLFNPRNGGHARQSNSVLGSGTGSVVAQLQAIPMLAIFGTNVHTWVFSIYAVPSIKDIAQLRGKKMAVTRFGGTMEFRHAPFSKERD